MRRLPLALSAAAGASGLALLLACGGTSNSGSSSAQGTPANTGTLAMVFTDAPADGWSKVEVTVKTIRLRSQADHTHFETIFSGSATVNLVDLDTISELLGTLQVPVGTYDRMELGLDLDPAKITLVDTAGNTVPSNKIVIGENLQQNGGLVPVTLDPVLTVSTGQTNLLQVDFDLAHPLSLFIDPAGNVVFNVRMLHKPAKAMVRMQFRPTRGQIKSVGTSSFVLTNVHNRDLTLAFDANTWFWDVDAKASGSAAGLAAGKYALVLINMQSDGGLFARRIYYSADASKLPAFTPEGHILDIDLATNRLWVSTDQGQGLTRDGQCRAKVIAIDPNATTGTQFFFEGDTDLGVGAAGLANLRRGFKINLEVRDPLATPMVARRINVQRAADEGAFSAVSGTSFTFGTTNARSYGYSQSPAFTWWPFADPTAAQSNVSTFVSAAQTGLSAGHAFGATSLAWDGTAKAWASKDMILMPERLPVGTIATAYSTGTKSLVLSYTAPGATTPTLQPVVLADSGAVQTVVLKIRNQNGVITTSLVPAANWAAELTTGVTKAWASVMPQSDGSLKAYTLMVYTTN